MTKSKVFSQIKSKLTDLLDGYKLFKDVGGNIFFSKEVDENTIGKVWITLTKRKHEKGYIINTRLSVVNRLVELIYHYLNESEYQEESLITKNIFIPSNFHSFDIDSDEDLEKWLKKIETVLSKENLALFDKYAKTEELENLMNNELQNKKASSFEALNYQTAEKGIILSKLVNGDDEKYQKFLEKIFSICKHLSGLGYGEYIYTDDFKRLVKLLDDTKKEELNVEFFKSKLNARRV